MTTLAAKEPMKPTQLQHQERFTDEGKEICRPHNYDEEGCLESKMGHPCLPGQQGRCPRDHDHCHWCGVKGHNARFCEDALASLPKSTMTLRGRGKHIKETEEVKVVEKAPYLYAIGGRNRGETVGMVHRYRLPRSDNFEKEGEGDHDEASAWERVTWLKEPRGSLGAAAVDGRVFAIGGSGVHSNLDTVEELDTATNTWEKSHDLSAARHALSACVSPSGTIYSVGGWLYGDRSSSVVERLEVHSSKLTGERPRWLICEPLKTARKLHGVAAVDGSVFAFGGQVTGQFKPVASVEKYDESSGKWSDVKSLPVPACCSAAAVGDKVYVFLWGSPKKYGVIEYNPQSDSYKKKSPLPLPEWYGFATTVWGQRIYVLGGSTKGKWTGAVYSYHTSEDKWDRHLSMPIVVRRLAAATTLAPVDTPAPTEVSGGGTATKKRPRDEDALPLPKGQKKDMK